MTNKYQEALDVLKGLVLSTPILAKDFKKDFDVLQELVDMVTPIADMNPNSKTVVLTDGGNPNIYELVDNSEYKAPVQVAHVYGTIIECPTCHQPITSLGKYCANCGQRIKPNEENG